MNKLKDIIKDIGEIRTKAIYNYEYKYYKAANNGNIELDNTRNNLYGTERAGYERFKQDTLDFGKTSVGYAGVTSLRPYFTDDVLKGYITETKKQENTPVNALMSIKSRVREFIIEGMKISDLESFEYYVFNNEPTTSFKFTYDSVITQINWWVSMYENYLDDEDFKKFMDKIIK